MDIGFEQNALVGSIRHIQEDTVLRALRQIEEQNYQAALILLPEEFPGSTYVGMDAHFAEKIVGWILLSAYEEYTGLGAVTVT